MTLRDDLIKAGAYAMCRERDHQPADSRPCLACTVLSEESLDAILATLADRADEWCESSDDTKMLDRAIPVELVEALRPHPQPPEDLSPMTDHEALARRVQAAHERWQQYGSDTNRHDIELLADVALAAVSDHEFTVTEIVTEVLDVDID